MANYGIHKAQPYGTAGPQTTNSFLASAVATPYLPDTANLYDSSANDHLYTDAAMALLYGDNSTYWQKVTGFLTVNASGAQGGVNTHIKGPDVLTYQLKLIGTWVDD